MKTTDTVGVEVTYLEEDQLTQSNLDSFVSSINGGILNASE